MGRGRNGGVGGSGWFDRRSAAGLESMVTGGWGPDGAARMRPPGVCGCGW